MEELMGEVCGRCRGKEDLAAKAPSKRMRKLGFCGVMGASLLLGIGFCAAWTPGKVRYYGWCLYRPQANPWYYARKMVECGPIGTRRLVQSANSDSVVRSWAEDVAVVMRKYSRHDVMPILQAFFADPDPRRRAFAAGVAGYLRDTRYLEGLQQLAADQAQLPAGIRPDTVGAWAEDAVTIISTRETLEEVAARLKREDFVEAQSSGPPRIRGMSKRR